MRVGFRTKRQPVGVRSRRGSKEACRTFIRSARRGVPTHPRGGLHDGDHRDRSAQGDAHGRRDRRRRTVACEVRGSRGTKSDGAVVGVGCTVSGSTVGDRVSRLGSASCWRSSSSRPASRSWTCRRRCRPGCGCSVRRQGRTTATTRCRPRSRGCVTAGCVPCASMMTPPCCGCWSAVTTTSSRCGPRRRVGSTRCCGSSSRVAHPGV